MGVTYSVLFTGVETCLSPLSSVFHHSSPMRSYKIDTNECIKNGFASTGDIIRDHYGHHVKTFLSSYGDCPVLEAELQAILDGISLACRLGLFNTWGEADSSVVVHCIAEGGEPWATRIIQK